MYLGGQPAQDSGLNLFVAGSIPEIPGIAPGKSVGLPQFSRNRVRQMPMNDLGIGMTSVFT